jgi:hypothetical protein
MVVGCTQKYADYDLIRKTDFLQSQVHNRPVAPLMQKGRADSLEKCFNQWLFFSNAENEKKEHIPKLVQVLCPGDEYLMESTITERWWTVLFYSQACVFVNTHCPKK